MVSSMADLDFIVFYCSSSERCCREFEIWNRHGKTNGFYVILWGTAMAELHYVLYHVLVRWILGCYGNDLL